MGNSLKSKHSRTSFNFKHKNETFKDYATVQASSSDGNNEFQQLVEQMVGRPNFNDEPIHYRSHSFSYDHYHRITNWTMEMLTEKNFESEGKVEIELKVDTNPKYKAVLKDFKKTKYVQLALSEFHQNNKEELRDTQLMTNFLPGPGNQLFTSLSRYPKELIQKHSFITIWVCSGPVISDPITEGNMRKNVFQLTGPNKLTIPKQLFKVILAEKDNKQYMSSFIVPNRELDNKENDIWDYEVSLWKLQKQIGLKLFPALLEKENHVFYSLKKNIQNENELSYFNFVNSVFLDQMIKIPKKVTKILAPPSNYMQEILPKKSETVIGEIPKKEYKKNFKVIVVSFPKPAHDSKLKQYESSEDQSSLSEKQSENKSETSKSLSKEKSILQREKADLFKNKITKHRMKLDSHGIQLEKDGKQIKTYGEKIERHEKKLDEHTAKLDSHEILLKSHKKKSKVEEKNEEVLENPEEFPDEEVKQFPKPSESEKILDTQDDSNENVEVFETQKEESIEDLELPFKDSKVPVTMFIDSNNELVNNKMNLESDIDQLKTDLKHINSHEKILDLHVENFRLHKKQIKSAIGPSVSSEQLPEGVNSDEMDQLLELRQKVDSATPIRNPFLKSQRGSFSDLEAIQ